MTMLNDLIKLLNTMLLVETRGESTKTMAACIGFTEQLIANEQKAAQEAKTTNTSSNDD